MEGPFPDEKHRVWAVAQGLVDLQDASVPTAGKVRGGARMVDDVLMPSVGDTFDLIIDAPYAGWGATKQIASAINANAQPQGPAVAVAVDERTVRVTIPEPERADRAGFVADGLRRRSISSCWMWRRGDLQSADRLDHRQRRC